MKKMTSPLTPLPWERGTSDLQRWESMRVVVIGVPNAHAVQVVMQGIEDHVARQAAVNEQLSVAEAG